MANMKCFTINLVMQIAISKPDFLMIISMILKFPVAEITKKDTKKDDLNTTVLVMQMGQFIDHDFAHSPNFQSESPNEDCCDSDFDQEKCFPIDIPANDYYFKSIGRRCMSFHRSLPTPNLNCELGKREQVKY